MKRQKKRSRDFWLELIRRYESTTNITQKQFALQNNVTLASFQFWLYTFRKQGRSTQNTEHNEEVRFIELAIPAPDKPKQAQVSLFFPNDLILEFSALPQPEYLAALMAALRESVPGRKRASRQKAGDMRCLSFS